MDCARQCYMGTHGRQVTHELSLQRHSNGTLVRSVVRALFALLPGAPRVAPQPGAPPGPRLSSSPQSDLLSSLMSPCDVASVTTFEQSIGDVQVTGWTVQYRGFARDRDISTEPPRGPRVVTLPVLSRLRGTVTGEPQLVHMSCSLDRCEITMVRCCETVCTWQTETSPSDSSSPNVPVQLYLIAKHVSKPAIGSMPGDLLGTSYALHGRTSSAQRNECVVACRV